MDHDELLRILESVDDIGITIESASDSEIEDEFEAVVTENLPGPNPSNVVDESDVAENISGPPPIQWTSQPFAIETPNFDDFGSGISPSLNLTSSSNELQILEKFVDEELIKTVVYYTNRYHRYFILNTDLRNHSRLQTWKEVTVPEMYIFLAITMLMTRNSRLTIEEHWSTNPLLNSPIYTTLMSRNRYTSILGMLHFSEPRPRHANDPVLSKIITVVDDARQKFQSFFTPYQMLCIDESIVPFKGRLIIKQYIPNKRNRFGIKLFVLCDVETRVVLDFIIYTGLETEIIRDVDLGIQIIYLAICSLTQAVYVNRMSPINRMATVNRMRVPTAFRPGVNLQSLQRPWNFGGMRLAQAASHRAPYVLYRNPPQRYSIKHYAPSSTRNVFAQSPWKTTPRLPGMSPVTSEYEFVKAASAQNVVHNDGGTGAIHTIPAPNLSLSEKPIVVIEASENPVSDQVKPSYEVTEKYPEGEYTVAKIEPPMGFSKATSFTAPELQTLIRNGAALQLASEYSLPAVLSQHRHIMPQQFQVQSLNNLPSHQDLLNTGAEGIFIPPNALYQSDPMFLQKLQSQLMQRFPSVEFIPYAANAPNQAHLQPQPQASQNHPQIVLLENEQLNTPLTIQVQEQNTQKTVVQRETPEASVVTLIPQAFVAQNSSEKQIEITTVKQPQNITVELVAAESQPVTTTVKYIIEKNTEEQNTTPIYYAQVGQSIGNVIAKGFYSAINDVRAAAAMAQVEKASEKVPEKTVEDITSTTTLIPDLNKYFVKNDAKSENITELKSLLGVPFKKATDSVNVAYTLVRADDKQPKVTQEGAVYAGQIVEATISEDQDFNEEKATLISKRAPIRLFAVADSNIENVNNTISPSNVLVKAKIPLKSKLIYDEKTGEPILRIYASYVDSPAQKDAVVAKLTSLKPSKDSVIKRDLMDILKTTVKPVSNLQSDEQQTFKATTVKLADKSQGFDANQVTQYGLKLKEKNVDYIPLFEDYED